MDTISLSSFCKEYDLAKSTVYKRAKALNMNVSEGLTLEQADLLLTEFGIKSERELEVVPVTMIDPGNHQIVLASPHIPQALTLGTLRDSEVQTFDDPLAIAQQFLSAADAVSTAMDADLQAREAKLKETRDAKQRIEKAADDLKHKQRSYSDRAWMLDQAATQESAELKDSFAMLQLLGKSPSVSD
jgi:hypothetical protein